MISLKIFVTDSKHIISYYHDTFQYTHSKYKVYSTDPHREAMAKPADVSSFFLTHTDLLTEILTFLKFCFHAKKVPRHQRKKVQKPGPGCVWMPSLSHPPLTSSGYFTAMSNSLETVEASISYHGRFVPRYVPIA